MSRNQLFPAGLSRRKENCKGAIQMAKLAISKPIILVDLFTNNQNAINETLQDAANLLQQQVQNGSLTPQLQSQLNNDLQFLSNAYGGGPVPNLPAGAAL